jgi:hypothetical protein
VPPAEGHSRAPRHDLLQPPSPAGPVGPDAGGQSPWRPSNDHRAHSTKLFVALAIAIAATIFVLFQFARLANSNKLKLSDGTFRLRGATASGQRFDKHPENGPFLFSDPTGGRSKDIYVSHITTGDKWAVFAASRNGDRRCNAVWRRASRDLFDPCTKQTFPIIGTGLPQFAWTVTDKDQLVIDLTKIIAGPGGPTTTTAASTTAASTTAAR